MSVHTRYTSLADLPALDASAAGVWLSPAERQAWQAMRSNQRRATWLAGRIAAKQLIGQFVTSVDAAEIDIASSRDGRGQRPSVLVADAPLACCLSIAHTTRGVLVAVTTQADLTLGVDLVDASVDDPRRLAWCFTPQERLWLAAHAGETARVWAMKEALYKACQQGEGFAPRQIEIVPSGEPRYEALAPTRGLRDVQSWRVDGHFAALAVVEPSCPEISQLQPSPDHRTIG